MLTDSSPRDRQNFQPPPVVDCGATIFLNSCDQPWQSKTADLDGANRHYSVSISLGINHLQATALACELMEIQALLSHGKAQIFLEAL